MFCNFCDNLLVDADIFIILGVSFFVTRNAFNLIIKKNLRAQFSKSSIPLSFFKVGGVVASVRVAQKNRHCDVSIFIFMVDGYIVLHKLARV